jgi:mono/diheme cytochrome c family protein
MKRVAAVVAVGIALSLTIGTRTAAAQAADGEALYRQHCRTCHGARGTPTQRMVGLYPNLKTLADSALLAGISVDSIVALLKKGQGKDMKSFSDKLTPDQMAAVARFVKTLASGSTHSP